MRTLTLDHLNISFDHRLESGKRDQSLRTLSYQGQQLCQIIFFIFHILFLEGTARTKP